MATLFNTKIKDTYQSLLKLEDNTILTTTSKNITDGLGNASPLYLSTTRVGIGTVTPLVPLDITGNTNLTGILTVGNYVNATGFGQRIRVIGQGDASVGIYRNQASSSAAKLEFMKSRGTYDVPVVVNAGDLLGNIGYFGYNGTSYSSSAAISSGVLSTSATGVEADVRFILYNNTGSNFNTMRLTKEGVGIGNALDYIPSATLQVRGSGSTSATTSLLVTNSGGAVQGLAVSDDGTAYIGWDSTGGFNSVFSANGNVSLGRYGLGLNYTKSSGSVRINNNNWEFNGALYFGNSVLGDGVLKLGAGSLTPSAMVSFNSTTQGFLAPRMTTVQRDAIASPATGLQVYNTTLGTLDIYDGTGWDRFGSQTLIRGAGTTSATTSLLVQDNSGNSAFQITDDRVVSVIGGSTLKITSPLSSGAPIILSNNGATGGYRGGYDFKSGYNGSEGNTAFRIASPTTTSSFVGIGNLTDSDVAGGAGKLQIENTLSTGRNAAIKLRVNFADIINQYNGIQFDTIESGSGGAFMGSQRNTAGSGYGSDLVILTTVETPANTYTETARFVGKSQSLSIGAGKTPTARLQVQGSGSTSATTSLLVQNSGGNEALKVTDDRTTTTTGTLTNLTTTAVLANGLGLTASSMATYTSTAIYKTGGGEGQIDIAHYNAFTSNGVTIRDFFGTGQSLYTVATKFELRILGGFTTPNGNNTVGNTLWMEPIYNVTAQFGTIVRGIYYNPTLTSLVNTKHYGIQTTSGGAYINTTTPQDSACLQADSTTQGFLPPRVTTIQKNAISSPAEGLFVYDSDLKRPCFFNGATWITL